MTWLASGQNESGQRGLPITSVTFKVV